LFCEGQGVDWSIGTPGVTVVGRKGPLREPIQKGQNPHPALLDLAIVYVGDAGCSGGTHEGKGGSGPADHAPQTNQLVGGGYFCNVYSGKQPTAVAGCFFGNIVVRFRFECCLKGIGRTTRAEMIKILKYQG
jgi:hypothetical protein